MLENAGITSVEDLHGLSVPPEVAGSTLPLPTPGELAYIISTAPGKGAGSLSGISLLDSTTGLPNFAS